jgi:SAM-dependent methyltransferase
MFDVKSLRAPLYKALCFYKPKFECPICGYYGAFKDKGVRQHAKCPRCGENERARLQYLVFRQLFNDQDCRQLSILHIAPEKKFREIFKQTFGAYTCADMNRADVDVNCDIQSLPFADQSFDVVFASHVLEYPEDDRQAIREFRRVLKAGGIAILPVPIMHEYTQDLAVRNPHTHILHEPGLDYFERFQPYFRQVTLYRSDQFAAHHQLLIYGQQHKPQPLYVADGQACVDIVPVCYA